MHVDCCYPCGLFVVIAVEKNFISAFEIFCVIVIKVNLIDSVLEFSYIDEGDLDLPSIAGVSVY